MEKVTLNKDGKPRKKGSGKTKGAGCYAKIPWRDLKKSIGADVPIPVSRVWLRQLGADVEKYLENSPTKLDSLPSDEVKPIKNIADEKIIDETSSPKPVSQTNPEPELSPDEIVVTPETEAEIENNEEELVSAGEEGEKKYQLPEDSLAATAYRYSQNFDL